MTVMAGSKPKLIGMDSEALRENRPPDFRSYEPLLQRNVKDGVPLQPIYSRRVSEPRRSRNGLTIVVAVLLCIVLVLSLQTYLMVEEDSERLDTVSIMLASLQIHNSTAATSVVVSTSTNVTTSTTLRITSTLMVKTTTTTLTITTNATQLMTGELPG
jgi:hypothetical protein